MAPPRKRDPVSFYDGLVPDIEAPSVAGLDPPRIVAGARLSIHGAGFPPLDSPTTLVSVGDEPARVVFASRDRLVIESPGSLGGGRHAVTIAGHADTGLTVDVATMVATGVHQVDSPVIDRSGAVYGTYSGSRGQEASVSIFRITPDGVREPFVMGIVNATSMALGPDGTLYVSSRFDGSVSRVFDDGRHEVVATDLGLACGIAFASDGTMFVGDRSGTIFALDSKGAPRAFATLPPSVAAFHLAMGPDGALYATAPTLSPCDRVYRIDDAGRVDALAPVFGRPQGLAFGPDHHLYVVEALAGASGVYRLAASGSPELVVAGPSLIGVAFGPTGDMVVCSSESLYRFVDAEG